MSRLLFLCTGNYYRSRFAELYFRHLAKQHDLHWEVDSRGLRLDPGNVGPLSYFAEEECKRLGISLEPLRLPMPLAEHDLERSSLTIAVKVTEHRPLMREKFPIWQNRIEYWEIHDLDCAPADEALPLLREHVDSLFRRLRQESMK